MKKKFLLLLPAMLLAVSSCSLIKRIIDGPEAFSSINDLTVGEAEELDFSDSRIINAVEDKMKLYEAATCFIEENNSFVTSRGNGGLDHSSFLGVPGVLSVNQVQSVILQDNYYKTHEYYDICMSNTSSRMIEQLVEEAYSKKKETVYGHYIQQGDESYEIYDDVYETEFQDAKRSQTSEFLWDAYEMAVNVIDTLFGEVYSVYGYDFGKISGGQYAIRTVIKDFVYETYEYEYHDVKYTGHKSVDFVGLLVFDIKKDDTYALHSGFYQMTEYVDYQNDTPLAKREYVQDESVKFFAKKDNKKYAGEFINSMPKSFFVFRATLIFYDFVLDENNDIIDLAQQEQSYELQKTSYGSLEYLILEEIPYSTPFNIVYEITRYSFKDGIYEQDENQYYGYVRPFDAPFYINVYQTGFVNQNDQELTYLIADSTIGYTYYRYEIKKAGPSYELELTRPCVID